MKCFGMILLIIILMVPLIPGQEPRSSSSTSPSKRDYNLRVSEAWNSFAEESKLWTTIVNNQITVKKRSPIEKAALERVKEKWTLFLQEAESLP